MLTQVPRGQSAQEEVRPVENGDAFEEALRRDLANTPVVSYDLVLGGWLKRAADIFTVLVTAPLWAPLTLFAALLSKLRYGSAFHADERVGYGGQIFRRYRLRIKRSANAAAQPAQSQSEQGDASDVWDAMRVEAEDRGAKWRYAIERLPQMINVLRGDMSMVGPAPLSREQVDDLKAAKRHYFSARPGLVGVSGILDDGDDAVLQYKGYAMSWSFLTDALLLAEAAWALPRRGELWRPGMAPRPKRQPEPLVLVRRRKSV